MALAEATATAVSAALAAESTAAAATINSAAATVAAAAATALATAPITFDPIDALSFARALAAADAVATLVLQAVTFQGARREAWTAAHKPL